MPIATSRLTRKYQATIPEAVREKLDLHAGDSIAFEIENNIVVVRKTRPIDMAFAYAVADTLTEWASEHDEEAYRDL